jgi:anti-anti-sigma factor
MDGSTFAFSASLDGTRATFTLAGEMDAFAAPDLGLAVDQLPGVVRIVHVDLAEVTFLDAGGIGTLIRIHVALAGRGAELQLVGASDYVRRVCVLAGVATTLGVKPSGRPGRCPDPDESVIPPATEAALGPGDGHGDHVHVQAVQAS